MIDKSFLKLPLPLRQCRESYGAKFGMDGDRVTLALQKFFSFEMCGLDLERPSILYMIDSRYFDHWLSHILELKFISHAGFLGIKIPNWDKESSKSRIIATLTKLWSVMRRAKEKHTRNNRDTPR